MTPEGKVVAECLEWLALHRIRAHRNNTGAGWLVPHERGKRPKSAESARWIEFGHPGSGDIIGNVRGIYLEVECKSAKGRARKLQVLRHRLINEDGGIHIYARSTDELERRLREHPRIAALGLDL